MCHNCMHAWIQHYLVDSVVSFVNIHPLDRGIVNQPLNNWGQGPVSRKPRKLFGPVKPFLVHL